MYRYTFRADYANGHELFDVEASHITDALRIARAEAHGAESVLCVGIIDLAPQTPLAF